MGAKEYLIDDYATTPIRQLVQTVGWEAIPITENNEELVALSRLGIPAASYYAGLHDFSPYRKNALVGATQDVYVREKFGERLVEANRSLPKNMTIVGLDGFRRPELQSSLYRYFYEQLRLLQPDWSEEMLAEYTKPYVSQPTDNPDCPAPHHTGGSFDGWLLTLPDGCDRSRLTTEMMLRIGSWLPAGVPFDHGGPMSATNHYEDSEGPNDEVFRRNRRIGFWLFAEVGIEPITSEYWHKNYGNQMAAITSAGKTALYGEIDLTNDQIIAEQISLLEDQRTTAKQFTNLPLGEIIRPVFDLVA